MGVQRWALASCTLALASSLQCDLIERATHSPSFCASVWAANLGSPRQAAVSASGQVLVLDDGVGGGVGRLVALWDDDANGVADAYERAVLLQAQGLGGGLGVGGGFLYAGSDGAVLRWPHGDGSREPIHLSDTETVLSCPELAGPLAVDPAGAWLYVALSAAAAGGAQVRRLPLGAVPAGGFTCGDGQLAAVGGALGLGLDGSGQLWAVGGSNASTGAASALRPGSNSSVGAVPLLAFAMRPPAQPSAMAFFTGRGCANTTLWRYRIENPGGGSPDMRYDYNLNDCRDDWEGDGTCDEDHGGGCPAGSDPLDCGGGGPNGCDAGGFPCEMAGDGFVSFAGGVGREGGSIVRVAGAPAVETPLLSNGGGGNPHPGWDATVGGFHPAALAFDGQGRLLAASPASGDLVLVRHGAACLAAAAHTASSSSTGRLASRRTEGQAALDTFALDPAANRCRDRGCRGARPEGEWWWFLLVAVGVLLVTGFCAGGVAYSVLRNRNIRRASGSEGDGEERRPGPEGDQEGEEGRESTAPCAKQDDEPPSTTTTTTPLSRNSRAVALLPAAAEPAARAPSHRP